MVRIGGGRATPQKLSDVEGMADARWPVPIRELSRVLGGGVVPGSIVGRRPRHRQIDAAAADDAAHGRDDRARALRLG